MNDVEHASPPCRRAKGEHLRIVIQFDHVGQGLMSNVGKSLGEFTICGGEHNFVPAQARIMGSTVVVSNANVSKPVAVRCAWKNDPVVNLYKRKVLPVGPFGTDRFDLITPDK